MVNYYFGRPALFLIMHFYVLCAAFFSLQIAVAQPVPSDVIVLPVRQSTVHPGWEEREYYTGMVLAMNADSVQNFIQLDVRIPAAGTYYLWALAASSRYDTSANNLLKISVESQTAQLRVKNTRATEWSNWPATAQAQATLQFAQSGTYTLRIEGQPQPQHRIFLDHILLTTNANYQPAGYVSDNRGVPLPPAWAFGVVYGGYTNQADTRARVERLIAEDYPIDGYWVDSWFWDYQRRGKGPKGYLDFIGDTVAFPNVADLWSFMDANHVKSGIWVWNTILKNGNKPVFQDFTQRGFFKNVELNTIGWHNEGNNSLDGIIDFTNEAAVRYWQQQLQPFFAKGLDFLKLDRSSAAPYLRAAYNLTRGQNRRGYILSHLHSTYDPASKQYPIKWTGDAKIAWSQPDYPDLGQYAMGGFKENIAMLANPLKTTWDVPFLAHDAGGYNFFGSKDMSDELYMRWTQFSLFTPITQVFSTADNPTANMPFHFSEQAQANFRYHAHWKMQLFPYLYSYAHVLHRTGEKITRGDGGQHPWQYLLGESLLVAPVYEPGARTWRLWLPPGRWADWHTRTVYEGNRYLDVPTEVDRLPLFARADAIIPLRAYARAIESGNNNLLTLLICEPGEAATFTLYEDDGVSEAYQQGEVALTTFAYRKKGKRILLEINKVEGIYLVMPATRSYQVAIGKPDAKDVRVNGRKLPRLRNAAQSSWDIADGTLRIFLPEYPRSQSIIISIR